MFPAPSCSNFRVSGKRTSSLIGKHLLHDPDQKHFCPTCFSIKISGFCPCCD
jgi:hypothetical protein